MNWHNETKGDKDYLYMRDGNTGETSQWRVDSHTEWGSGSESRGKTWVQSITGSAQWDETWMKFRQTWGNTTVVVSRRTPTLVSWIKSPVCLSLHSDLDRHLHFHLFYSIRPTTSSVPNWCRLLYEPRIFSPYRQTRTLTLCEALDFCVVFLKLSCISFLLLQYLQKAASLQGRLFSSDFSAVKPFGWAAKYAQ